MTRNPFGRNAFVAATVVGAVALSCSFRSVPRRRRGDHSAAGSGCEGCRRHPDRGHRRRLLLGRAGRVPAHKGVINAVSGYAGGDEGDRRTTRWSAAAPPATPSRCEIKYDPSRSATASCCRSIFSVAHDPTQLNRQGPDSGTQYRSAIFPTNDEQAKVAKAYIAQLDGAKVYNKPIVTRMERRQGVLSGRGLSSGLPDAASRTNPILHTTTCRRSRI